MTHVTSLLLGLGNGGVFAALAVALVLTYRSSGVVNFATGTIALVHGVHLRVAARGEAARPRSRASQRRSSLGRSTRLRAGRADRARARRGARRTALRGRVPAAPAGSATGPRGCIARCPRRRCEGLIENRVGTGAGQRLADLPVESWHWGSVTLLSDRFYLAVAVLGLTLALTAAVSLDSLRSPHTCRRRRRRSGRS